MIFHPEERDLILVALLREKLDRDHQIKLAKRDNAQRYWQLMDESKQALMLEKSIRAKLQEYTVRGSK